MNAQNSIQGYDIMLSEKFNFYLIGLLFRKAQAILAGLATAFLLMKSKSQVDFLKVNYVNLKNPA
jgi:hypothetical protein